MNAPRFALACLIATSLAACDSIPTAPAADQAGPSFDGGLVLGSGNAATAQTRDVSETGEDASANSGAAGVTLGSGSNSVFITPNTTADRGGVISGSGN